MAAPVSHAAGVALEELDPHLVMLLRPGSFAAEQYRALRHTVEAMRSTAAGTVVAVSSPVVGDGKTTTAINLAAALAESPDAKVLLCDADLRAPSVASYLGLDGAGPGLADVIRDVTLPLEAVVRRRPPFGVWLLPAGRCSSPPYELLNSARFGQLLDEARQRYDYVVLDTPPVVPVLDCRVLAKWVDGIVMVVAAHRTPRKLLQEALESIDRARIAGLVFNHDDRPLWRRYRDRYTYGMYGQDPVRDGNGPGRPGAPSMTPGPGGRRP